MEKFSLVWTKMICFGFMLLKIELTNGAVNIPTTGTPYIGDSFLLECHITPFTGTANWAKDGTTQTTCGTSFCAPPTLGNYSFSFDASGISVTIDPVSTSDGGTWQCTHSSGTDGVTLSPTTKSTSPDNPESNKPTTIIAAVLGSFLGLIACIGLMIFLYKRIGHQSESPGKNTPQEPRGPLKINNVEDHIIFEWESPKSDGGSKITEYIVELQGNNFDTWELVGSSYKITLKVPMYQFKDKGVMSFRVRAKNAVGFSKPLLAQEPFNLQNSYALLADRPVQGRGPAGQVSLLDGVPTDRKLPEPE